jgi:hypothetical protein
VTDRDRLLDLLTDAAGRAGVVIAYAPVAFFGGVWAWGVWVICCGVVMYAASCCRAAPLPPARPTPRPPEPAAYLCLWGGPTGVLYDVLLFPGGRYECRREGCAELAHVGTWTQEGMTLHVAERDAHATASSFPACRWSVGPEGPTINGNPGNVLLERVR